MGFAEFTNFSYAFLPFIITISAIAVSVTQRNLRAPIMLSGFILSAFLYSNILAPILQVIGGTGGEDGEGGGIPDFTACEKYNAMLPYLSIGLVPKANLFFLTWVTAYLSWSQGQWSGVGSTNGYLWAGIALAWILALGNVWQTSQTPGCAPMYPYGIITLVAGVIFGIGYGALVGSISPTSLYFAPLASDNVVCARPSKQTFKCTIGSNNLS